MHIMNYVVDIDINEVIILDGYQDIIYNWAQFMAV